MSPWTLLYYWLQLNTSLHCQVAAAAPYPGGFPELGPPLVHSQGVDYRFKEAYSAAKMILEGARMLVQWRPQGLFRVRTASAWTAASRRPAWQQR